MTKYRVWATYTGVVEAESAKEAKAGIPLVLDGVYLESVDVVESHLLDSYTEGKP